MKQMWMCLVVMWAGASAWAEVTESNDVPFVPWGALEIIDDMGPSWLKSEDWIQYLYTVNDKAYPLAFGLARSDGGPRGANALTFVLDGETVGHHVAEQVQGAFEIANTGDTNTFEDLILMVSLDANQLNPEFGFRMWTDSNESLVTFEPARDFVWYDPCALGYDTGRPSGLYALTNPSYEPVSYLFNRGMTTLYSFEQVKLKPGASVRLYYEFNYLQARAVFSVYGCVNKKEETTIYHTNRSVANPENPEEQVTTFAVIPPYLKADLDGNGLINLRDVSFLGQCIGQTWAEESDPECFRADLDANGQVDMEDAKIVLGLIQDYFEMNDPNESLFE